MKLTESNLKVRPVSRGVCFGKVLVIHGNNKKFYKVEISKNETSAELKRFEQALDRSVSELNKLISSKKGLPNSASAIFDTHKIILTDNSLSEKIKNEIVEKRVNAEWAVKSIFEDYISQFKSIADKHIRQKYIDLDDVSDRLLKSLRPPKKPRKLPAGTIIVIKELTPSMLIEISKSEISGIISERGGWTSHSFILARELNIPAVTGIRKAVQRFNNGDSVLIDAYKGVVVINPSVKKIKAITSSSFNKLPVERNKDVLPDISSTLKTIDGHKIKVLCNADKVTIFNKAKQLGAKGIGLYRTELLISENNKFPSENLQYKLFSEAAGSTGEHGVRIRIYDIGPDTFPDHFTEQEKNPALGLRAVRLAFTQPKFYKNQIRAILRASSHGVVEIVLPMVSGLDEIRRFKAEVEKEKEYLLRNKIPFSTPRIGAMIEIPSAVLMIDQILSEVDSVCLGTNDLVQYLTAVDRDNELVSEWFQTLHPANIKAIKNVITSARNHNKPVVICGEMAGSPYYVPLLIGLGATELSMNLNSISKVRRLVSGIAFNEALELADRVLKMDNSKDISDAIRSEIKLKWHHLYDNTFDF